MKIFWTLLIVIAFFWLSACEEEDNALPSCPSDQMIEINAPARGFHFFIDKYEASRSNATADSPGEGDSRACSMPNVLPWNAITLEEAQKACEASGKRLCTPEEWIEACQSAGAENTYPYGRLPEEGVCHVGDAHGSVAPTGQYEGCKTLQGALDMTGNIREWTEVDPLNESRLFGGAYASGSLDVTCKSSIAPPDAITYEPGVGDGFRCCKDAP